MTKSWKTQKALLFFVMENVKTKKVLPDSWNLIDISEPIIET